MSNRLYFLIVLATILSLPSKAQESKTYDDRIFLNNGSTLTGTVMYYNPMDSLTFEFPNNTLMTFPSSIVKKIIMANGSTKEANRFKENKWYTRTQFSILYSRQQKGVSVSQSFGYQYRHWLAFGIGAGIDNYVKSKGNNLIPVFGEIRSFLMKRNSSPYLAFRYGYAFADPQEDLGQTFAKGSYFFNPVIGYRLGAGSPYLDVFCGMKFQDAQYETRDSWSKNTFDFEYRRYDLGIALTF